VKGLPAFVIPVLLAGLLSVGSAFALDTAEPFDRGFSDFEFFFGCAGLGLDKGERRLSREVVIGVGITESFSAAFSYGLESDEYLKSEEDAFATWLFWTALDGERHDLDLFGGFETGGGISVGAEFNFDFQRWGFQLVVEDGIGNRGAPENEPVNRFSIAPLVYFDLVEGKMQLMSQIDRSYNSDASEGEDELTTGAVSLGLNIMLHDSVELITQLDYEVSSDDHVSSLGINIGFVATIGR